MIKNFIKTNMEFYSKYRLLAKYVKSINKSRDVLLTDNMLVAITKNKVYLTRPEVVRFIKSNKEYDNKFKIHYLQQNLTEMTREDYKKFAKVDNQYLNTMQLLLQTY